MCVKTRGISKSNICADLNSCKFSINMNSDILKKWICHQCGKSAQDHDKLCHIKPCFQCVLCDMKFKSMKILKLQLKSYFLEKVPTLKKPNQKPLKHSTSSLNHPKCKKIKNRIRMNRESEITQKNIHCTVDIECMARNV